MASIKKSMALKGNKNAAKGYAKIGGLFASIGPAGAYLAGRNTRKVLEKKNPSVSDASKMKRQTALGAGAVGIIHGAAAGAVLANPIVGAAIGATSYAGLSYAGSRTKRKK
jgi:hypothetical protein